MVYVEKLFVGEILDEHSQTSGEISEKDSQASSQNIQNIAKNTPKDSNGYQLEYI